MVSILSLVPLLGCYKYNERPVLVKSLSVLRQQSDEIVQGDGHDHKSSCNHEITADRNYGFRNGLGLSLLGVLTH